jgi:hypothetical protein
MLELLLNLSFYFAYSAMNLAFVKKKSCEFVLVDGLLYVSALKQGYITILI